MKTGYRLIILFFCALMLCGCASHRDSRTANFSDPELSRASQLARVAWDKGSLAQAETLFRQAHRRAREMDDAAELGNAAYNLAAVLIARDRTPEAWPLLDEAEIELARAGQPILDVLLVKANLAAASQRTADATGWLDVIEKSPALLPRHRAQVALVRGDLAAKAKNHAEAHRQLSVAQQFALPANPILAAGIEKLSGNIALLESRPADAAKAFAQEAKFFQIGKSYRSMAQALARAGEAFASAEDSNRAAEYFYRAARTGIAQGQSSLASDWIRRGTECAQLSDDKSLKLRFERLARESDAGTQ